MVSSQETCKIKTRAKPDVMLLVALPVFWPASLKHCGIFRHRNSDSNETMWSVIVWYVRKFCYICLMLGEIAVDVFKALCDFCEEMQ